MCPDLKETREECAPHHTFYIAHNDLLKRALKKEHILRLANCDINIEAKLIFLFMYYSRGMELKDLALLNENNITIDYAWIGIKNTSEVLAWDS